MSKLFQRLLLIIGVISVLALGIEIALSVLATTHASTAKRMEHVTAGPYHLLVSLYDDPANAGFALPFAIIPEQATQTPLTFDVFSIPARGLSATPVRASITHDSAHPGGIQGDAEITVQGSWTLQIQVSGSAGQGTATLPIQAIAPPAIPSWLGWIIGLIPFYGLLIFFVFRWRASAPKLIHTSQSA